MVDGSQAAGRVLTSDANGVGTWQSAGGGLNNVVEDLTPQLGGLLDTNGNGIDLNGGNLDLDNSTAATGNITKNGTPFLHNFGNSTFLGSNAGNFTTTGGANTAVGLQALFNNISGDHNTGDGYGALFMNTSGGNNTASGWFALRNNTTGNNNIALGNDAGMNLATGDNNIAIGNPGGSAAESSTTRIGSLQTRAFIAGIRGVTTDVADAIAVMIDSNGQLGTAPANIFTTNGTRTTGVGFGTLQQTMTGLNNTGMGWAVLVHNTSGSNNVGVGSGATAGNTSGSGNTALGTGALSTNQNGNNNIAIGHEVSFTANGISNSINVGGPQTIGSGDMVLGTQGTQTRTFIAGIRGITTCRAVGGHSGRPPGSLRPRRRLHLHAPRSNHFPHPLGHWILP